MGAKASKNSSLIYRVVSITLIWSEDDEVSSKFECVDVCKNEKAWKLFS